jgi:hypothetical protein
MAGSDQGKLAKPKRNTNIARKDSLNAGPLGQGLKKAGIQYEVDSLQKKTAW